MVEYGAGNCRTAANYRKEPYLATQQMCNFTCVYCDYGNGKAFTNTRYPMSNGELSVEQWLNVWSQIMDHVDYASVTISGGEPTLAAAFYPVIELIGSKYLINMTTNGSQPLLRLARQVQKKRLVPHRVFGEVYTGLDQINMSLHPSSRNFHEMTFKGNALMLKNAGFNVMVNFVGYPPQLYLAREYKQWCEQNDLPFMLLEWGHGDRLGNSPSYTPHERAYLVSLMTHGRRVNAAETPVANYTLDIETASVRISRFGQGSVGGTATNKSQFAWKRGEPLGVKIGARIYGQISGDKADWRSMSQSKRGDLVCELRCPLETEVIAPNGCTSFEFSIRGEDFKPGFYTVVVDVVDEGKYWFADLGTMPTSVILQIA